MLTVLSATWLAVLTLEPAWQGSPASLALTATALCVNGITSFGTLIVYKRIPFILNVLQILLFAMAHSQLYEVGGPEHYDAPPGVGQFDWQLFAWSHALSASDLVHLLERPWRLNPIKQRSAVSGLLLVVMHWNVSLFVVSILIRCGLRSWRKLLEAGAVKRVDRLEQLRRTGEWKTRLKRWQRRGLIFAVGAFLFHAGLGNWHPLNWLLWPLDNLVRTMDLGNTLGVFGWQLHSVERSPWTALLGIFFRLMVCATLARALHALHVRWLGSRALRPLEDYILDLNDDSEKVRAAAAQALGEIGSAARQAVPALVQTVDDDDGAVVCGTRQALALIGPPAMSLVPDLLALLENPNWAVRRAAVQSLGRLGSAARAALPALVVKIADADRTVEKLAEHALSRIDPDWARNASIESAVPTLVRKLEHRDQRIRQRAAEVLGRLGSIASAALPHLVARLKDRHEYVRSLHAWRSIKSIRAGATESICWKPTRRSQVEP